MAELHFLRPWWLLALPVGLMLIGMLLRRGSSGGAWRNVVDESLQPYVLAVPGVLRDRYWPAVASVAACVLTGIALAGPTWERAAVPAFRSDDALVVVLGMARSMDAPDVEPSRLARVRLKLLSLLERREGGQTALVVFSGHAFTVTPLTTDTRTIAALVHALSTDIMPSAGNRPEAGLAKAVDLLHQAGSRHGEVLLIGDSAVSQGSLEAAAALNSRGYRVNVLAVGTEQGAPIGLPGGGFLSDNRGALVIPRLDVAGLRALAQAGGGRFAVLTPDDRDLDRLLPAPGSGPASVSERPEDQVEADAWLDRGAWLAVLVLPLLALAFRRGWIAMIAVALLLPVPRAQAFELASLWQRPDQRAYSALEAEQPARAAELFRDPEWRAAALYRAGDYAASAEVLDGRDSVVAHYNRGNALARAGQLPAAIDAYDQALALDTEHEDARYNRALLEELLRQNPELADAGQDGEQGEQGQAGDDRAGSSDGDTSDDPESGGEPGSDNGAFADSGAQDDAGQDPARGGDDSAAGGDPEQRQTQLDEPRGDPGETRDDGQDARTGGIEDVEQWASEQAAEQWLRRVPQDPGGLLRRKFELQYRRMGLDEADDPARPGGQARPR